MIIRRRLFDVAQMIISGSAQKVCDRNFGELLGAEVERFDDKWIVLIFTSGKSQVAVRRGEVGLHVDRGQKFLLSFGELFGFEKGLPEALVEFGIVGVGGDQLLVSLL